MLVLSEDDVVAGCCIELERHGWRIVSRASAREKWDDVVAERGGRRLIVEAKGEGSSRVGSKRYGSEFDAGQVNNHVGRAVLRVLRAVSAGAIGMVALPDNRLHRHEVELAQPALRNAGVVVCWVSGEGASFDPPEAICERRTG